MRREDYVGEIVVFEFENRHGAIGGGAGEETARFMG